jgi:hypothetical protein
MQTQTQPTQPIQIVNKLIELGVNMTVFGKGAYCARRPETRETVVFYPKHEFWQFKGKRYEGNIESFATWAKDNGFSS